VLPWASAFLPNEFDAGVSSPRLLLLVSPTCPLCLSGVDDVIDGLDSPAGRQFDIHLVWLPVLEEDNADAADEATDLVARRHRVKQYWDEDRSISFAAHAVFGLASRRRRVEWDLYLFYRAGAEWTQPLSVPDLWLDQLNISDQASLDERTLSWALRVVSN
jgi:hypothetical protein